MGYLFLLASICSGAIKGFFGKKISDKTSGIKSAVLSNIIRMLFCIPIGFIFVLFDGGVSTLGVSIDVLLISALAGVATSVFIVSWLLGVQKGAYSTVDTFVAMSVLVPIIFSVIFYGERVSLSQIIGLLLLFSAVIIMSLYTNQIKQKMTLSTILLLLVVSLANGFADFSFKIFNHRTPSVPASVFNFYIYVFSAIILTIVFFCLKEKAPADNNLEESELSLPQKKADLDKRKILYIAIMALCLFCHSLFKTLAASRLDSVQLFPLQQGTAICISLFMAAAFFKERINPLCVVGVVILFIGLLFLNVITF